MGLIAPDKVFSSYSSTLFSSDLADICSAMMNENNSASVAHVVIGLAELCDKQQKMIEELQRACDRQWDEINRIKGWVKPDEMTE